MKIKYTTLVLSFTLFLCATAIGIAQTTSLFEETFDESTGSTNGNDVNGIVWSSVGSFSADYFAVAYNGFFALDTDAMVTWKTNPIDISGYDNLNLSLYLQTDKLDNSDYFKIKYKVDGVEATEWTRYNDFTGYVTRDLSDLTGNTLEIIFEFRNDQNDEFHYIDNVELTGSQSCVTPAIYAVTGSDLEYCSGDTQTTAIGLDGSESGVTYQLLRDGSDVGAALSGSGLGSAIDFGDFNTAGTYTVEATRTDGGCTQTMAGNVVITNDTGAPTASFTASATIVDTTQAITFTNSSSNATSYTWDFGDGSSTSILENPTHTFTAAGTFTVTLTATNSCGSDTATEDITVYAAGTCSAVGTILMEKYDGISGKAISDLTGNANYPENPSSDAQLTSFEISTDTDDYYGVRVNGYICAPQTGYYTFWIASDDNGQLNLSTDDDPANKTTIAWVDSWTSSREWDKFTSQKSDPILLIMGESYYVEALMKEDDGGDNLAVGWAKPGETTVAPSEVIPGSVLSPAVSNYFAPEDLFYEDFSGYPEDIEISDDVDTITGSGTSATNPNGVSWSLTGPESANEIKLHHDGGEGDNGHIHTKKVNGTATFETDPITVSGYTGLNLKIYVDKLEKLDNNDTIEFGYDLDGLGYTEIETITGYGDFTVNGNKVEDVTIDSDIIAIGDSLVIYIKITHNNNWDEKFEWDDITLTGTPFYNVWQGTESDQVTNTAKWSKGSQPTEASNVWIPNTKHLKLTDDQAYNTVNARATSQLTIEKTGSLTTVGDFTKIAGTGTVTLNSDSNEFASIIVGGTATGEITYNKYINYLAYQEWDLVGSPVLNQNMQSFAQTHTNSSNTGSLAFDDPYYALGEYLTEWGNYSNYTTSTIPNSSFPAGKGFQMATNPIGSGNDMEGQTLAFTGEIATASQSIDVQNLNGTNNGYGRRWNLVANPYPSYIDARAFLEGNSSIANNTGNITIDGNYGALYVWRTGDETDEVAGNGKWGIYNMLQNGVTESGTGDFQIAPGQAFYVAAASTDVAQIQFTPSMRRVTGGDDFISGAPVLLNSKLDLKLYNGSTERAKTKFHFQQGLTLGLEPAYDAAAYNQAAALSSRLPEDDQGVNFQLNAMNIEAAYNQTIPLVVNQQEGQSFRISISNNTLPEDINVYLEDVFNGTLTSLKNQDFELVAQEDLSQDGRFYIRFTTESLAVNDVLSPSSITVFKLNTDNFITIKGLSPEMGKTTATLYNMLGMKVREKTLNNTAATQQISTQGLSSGVYIINLKAGEQAVSKKVIIQ